MVESDETTPATRVPGRSYACTQVQGWWPDRDGRAGHWWPVMGPAHDDREYFDFPMLHYHVDPRLLSDEKTTRWIAPEQRRGAGRIWGWQPASYKVLSQFETNGGGRLTIRPQGGRLLQREGNGAERLSRDDATILIRTRTARRLCRRELPVATFEEGLRGHDGFVKLRASFKDAQGLRCPHRGYDLSSVPIDANGFRQCPLHQLLVRAYD